MVVMARSLLKEREVLAKFLGKAVRYAFYTLNKLSTRALSNITLHEVWFGQKSNVDYLKVMDCISYMKVPAIFTQNLNDRSKLLIHFGREPGTKACRLYDPKSGRIHISKDVTFNEAKS